MKRNRTALAGTALLAVGAIALAGCASGGDNGSGEEGGEASTGIVTVQSNAVSYTHLTLPTTPYV